MGDPTPRPPEEAPGDSAEHADPEPPYVPGGRPRHSWVAPGSSDVVEDASNGEPADDGGPTRGRRVLARIPGLSRLAEQSGWVGNGGDEQGATDPGWVFHEGGGPDAFEGWLYHYVDGTMVDAEGTEYAFPDGATDPEAVELVPEPEPAPEPRPEAAAQPQPEPEPEPEAEAEPQPEPTPQSDAEPEPTPVDETSTPSDIPGFVEYSPIPLRGYVLGAVFLIAAVTGVLTAFVAVRDDSSAALVIAGGCAVLALVAWWALLGWKPTVVSIREGVLDITRGDRTDTFELTDAATVVEFNGRPGSPTWTAVVRHANGRRTTLRSSQVKPRQFERIVRHHRTKAQAHEPTSPDEATRG